MPNTLCHIGIQAPLNGAVLGPDRLTWVLIACIIPDLPWLTLKVLIPLHLFDPYDLRLYCTAQASLLFCLFCSAALAAFTTQPKSIFILLGSNCLFHLLLDSLEIKWGNGVHFIAPLSWTMLQFDTAWPGHPVILFFTAVGLFTLCISWRTIVAGATRLHPGDRRTTAIGLLCLGCYLLGPTLFLNQLEQSDVYFIQTLRAKEQRPGKTMAFDRAHYSAEQKTLKTFAGEPIFVTGSQPETSGRVSFRGHFLTPTNFASTSHHYHRDYRDLASLVGLFMACTLLLQSLLLAHFRAHKQNQEPS